MPTYSYQCTQCGDKFDIVQSFSDNALTTCEKCDGKLRKLFNSVGIVFKGSGFYRTDSRNGSATASEPAKPSGNNSSGSDSSSSSSSTPSTTSTSTSTAGTAA
ncbi:FmdB family zinc ribbon protein [Nocardia pseudobrasiliensis]|uniref:Putative FmdB family regulatory protein n=1 Tax=Nocardia pseudobrasiliensis TaxID=45979 RepID=A0A370I7G4_9NOCA|nr:FmdB family zinc ribbon protein [Nocardia pseudobrasiliensis]RDI66676.1 putative FmdB family regulatory protein [Nocardia pseudobrasiliensis]